MNYLIYIFSGLSIFLLSLDLIKVHLNTLFSSKIYSLINRFTDSKFKSFLFGCLSAAILQSSSGVTAISISLLAAKYIKEEDCLGIIIGANLGTCLTTFIFAINIQNISLLLILFSSIIYLIFKQKRHYIIVCLYIGFMLLGLDILKYGFGFIINSPIIYNILLNIQNDFLLSLLFGITSTAIIQSSSGIIGIVENMFASDIINLNCSIIIMLAANIGTTLTGYISTINTDTYCKKIINCNLIFNIIGVLLFIIFLKPFINTIAYLQNNFFLYDKKMVIALGHFVFNFVTVILGYIFFPTFKFYLKKIDK